MSDRRASPRDAALHVRDVVIEVLNRADLVEKDDEVWLVARVSPDEIDALAAYGAELEDVEDGGDGEPDYEDAPLSPTVDIEGASEQRSAAGAALKLRGDASASLGIFIMCKPWGCLLFFFLDI